MKGTTMDKKYIDRAKKLMSFIEKSPTAFHAVDSVTSRLESEGYSRIDESDRFELRRGGKYYVTRNRSSVIAFRIPDAGADSFMIAASHSDSPMFKLKSNSVISVSDKYAKLNVERYGGMIMSSWFDRPLSVAGRVIIGDGGKIHSETVNIDRDIAVIPNVCIHFNRTANDGYKYNAQVDLLPIIGAKAEASAINGIIAKELGIDEKSIISSDLYLYNRMKPTFIGLSDEFFSAPRIDNLACAYCTFEGLIESAPTDGVIQICAMFDNEETGSESKQGADSTFLHDIMLRICGSLGISHEEYMRMIPASFMLSADNGHARHPNHPELSDCNNSPFMNEGVVIKYNANQRYTTDAVSAALFGQICECASVPTQVFANRSDLAGGSTLGNISSTHVSINTVDIGLAQLAMHSSYETAGTADIDHMIRAVCSFFGTRITCRGDGIYEI